MHNHDQQLLYRIALMLIPGVGTAVAKNLVSYCGSAEAVFNQKQGQLEKIPGIGPVMASAVVRQNVLARAEEECRFIKKSGITPLFYLDEAYPKRLSNCEDAPVMLYYKGNHDLNSSRMLAIVGTRLATDYGKSITEQLVVSLAEKNICIVSGLAYGIDIAAHKAAVTNQVPTIGVLGHGLDRIYPAGHRATADKMAEQGGLLTEYISQTLPDKNNFPERNRIIAGISDGVIVVEAAKKGGALITAHIADSYNRDVFAVPGKLNDEFSAGCNHLIKTNKAVLIESAADIIYIMGWDDEPVKKKPVVQRKMFVDLNEEERMLMNVLEKNGSMHIDAICLSSDLSMSKVAMNLLNMEFNGLLKSMPGKLYALV